MENVIIYTRVSTDEQADKGYSLRDQKDRLEKYCELKGFNILNHYQEDHSAKSFDRPEFKKLLDFVKQNKSNVDRVLVVKWDRFSRNVTDALMMLRTFGKMNVEVNAVEQPIDTNIPEQKMMLSFYLTAPEVENDRRAMNTTNGMRRAMKEGRWVASAPLGYKYGRDAANKPVLVLSEKAPIVKEAFEMYAKGLYDKEEVRKKLAKKGMTLQKAAFWCMLHNPVYCGKIFIKAHKDEPEQTVQGIHPAIVSEELFMQVQLVAQGKKRIKAKPKKKIEALPLRGHLVCSCCGKNLTGSASRGNGGTYFYYHCQPGCKERHKADVAHSSFSQWLESISFKPEVAALYLEVMEDIFKSQEGDREKEVQRLKGEIGKRREMVEKVERKFIEDDLDKDSYKRLKNSYQREQFQLTDQLNDLQHTDTAFMEYAKYGFSLLSNLNKHFQEAELDAKQKLVGLIFPEKLYYTGSEYRTTKPSEVFSLLCNSSKGFKGFEKEKVAKNSDQFGVVVPAGIEPASKV